MSLVFVSWQVAIVPFALLLILGLAVSVWPRVSANRQARRRAEAGPHRRQAAGGDSVTPPSEPTPLGSAARPDRPPRSRDRWWTCSAQARAAQAIADRSRSEGVWSLGHLKICWLALGIGGVALAVAGWFLGGLGAVFGVLLGTVIVGAFFTFSAVVIAWVGKTNPKTVMVAALFAYVIKVFVLAIVLMTMPIDGPVNVRWMAGAIGLGLFLWLGAHMRYVWTLKIYYVDPG